MRETLSRSSARLGGSMNLRRRRQNPASSVSDGVTHCTLQRPDGRRNIARPRRYIILFNYYSSSRSYRTWFGLYFYSPRTNIMHAPAIPKRHGRHRWVEGVGSGAEHMFKGRRPPVLFVRPAFIKKTDLHR